jgi:L-arabinose isomerase
MARFGDNMRDVAVTEGDKVEASCGSASRSTPTASTTWSLPSTRCPMPRWTRWPPSTTTAYAVVPDLRPDGPRRESLRYAVRQELGLRGFLDEGGFSAFTTNFQDLGGLRSYPASRSSA